MDEDRNVLDHYVPFCPKCGDECWRSSPGSDSDKGRSS